MGTRALTVIKEEDGTEICVIYRQMDGYPEGHGAELKDILKGVIMVNGITCGTKANDIIQANGMPCLTATIIKGLKKGVGGIYIYPAGTRDCGEDYIYTVTGKTGQAPTIDIKEAR
jgi:hypothetical protein